MKRRLWIAHCPSCRRVFFSLSLLALRCIRVLYGRAWIWRPPVWEGKGEMGGESIAIGMVRHCADCWRAPLAWPPRPAFVRTWEPDPLALGRGILVALVGAVNPPRGPHGPN